MFSMGSLFFSLLVASCGILLNVFEGFLSWLCRYIQRWYGIESCVCPDVFVSSTSLLGNALDDIPVLNVGELWMCAACFQN